MAAHDPVERVLSIRGMRTEERLEAEFRHAPAMRGALDRETPHKFNVVFRVV